MSNAFEDAVRLHQNGRLHEAIQIYKGLLTSNQNNAQLLYLIGTACAQVGNNALGIELLARSLHLFPESPYALNNLGVALQACSRLDEALDLLNKAIAVNPGYADAHNNRGNVLQDLHRLRDAFASYSAAS